MALKDLWKLQDYIPESAKQWIKKTLESVSEILPITAGGNLAAKMYKYLHGEMEISGKDATKLSGKLLSELIGDLDKEKVPAWAITPLTIMTLFHSVMNTTSQIANVTLEKNVLQNLRKTISPALLDAQSALQAEMRGTMKAEDVDEILARLGFDKLTIKTMRELMNYIPTAQDIVSFAVRESYNDSVARTFKTDDQLSNVLAATEKDRKAAGLTPDLFKRYWRAHWDLPGIGQGFEMFQRGQMSREELETLLQVKDIMPFFRDKLLNISYNLLTRVDVRRMHKLKLISDGDLAKEYQRMGHSPDDAVKLAKFTVEYNKNPEAQDKTDADANKTKERDLTKVEVLTAFDAKLIDQDKTKTLLTALGYDETEVTLLLARQAHKDEMDTLDALLKCYKDLYVRGIADKADVQKELQNIPLPTENIEKLFFMWDLERYSKMDLPTKAEILTWVKKKQIDKAEAADLLRRIGTQERFVTLYLKAV